VPRRLACLLFVPLALAGCAHSHEVVAPPTAEQPSDTWRGLVTVDDRGRLRHWRNSFTNALTQAHASADAIAREGPLLDPDAALAGVRLPAGDYRCRTIKLGSQRPGGHVFTAYEPHPCRVSAEGARLHFAMLDGPQRPLGAFFPDTARRMIFLGTLQLGDESLAYRYGRDRERDMIGLLERIGEHRWRLVLPAPQFESLLDVIELVPA
jgi:uncharacterized protein DUF4893